MYGTSSYNSYPYRHPFVTMHDVVHDSDGARLSEGELVTPRALLDLIASLGASPPVEILPEQVIVRTADTIVWWAAARERTLFFSDRGGDAALKRLNGKTYPQPPLVFKACGSHLWIRALAKNERPKATTKLYGAPYWNCYDNGVVCTGSMRVPQERSIAAIDLWEAAFFQSEFSHGAGVRRHTKHRGGLLALWQALQGKSKFPSRYLTAAEQTLAEFVNDHDHTYRNANQAG